MSDFTGSKLIFFKGFSDKDSKTARQAFVNVLACRNALGYPLRLNRKSVEDEALYWLKQLWYDEEINRPKTTITDNIASGAGLGDDLASVGHFLGDTAGIIGNTAKVIVPGAINAARGVGKAAIAVIPPTARAVRKAGTAAGKAALGIVRSNPTKLGNLAKRAVIRTIPVVGTTVDMARAAQDYDDLVDKTNSKKLAAILTAARGLLPTVATYAIPALTTATLGPVGIPVGMAAAAALDGVMNDQNTIFLRDKESETEIPYV